MDGDDAGKGKTMAGIILKKTWNMLLVIMKVFLYIAWLSIRAACSMLKLFLLLFFLVLRLMFVVSVIFVGEE